MDVKSLCLVIITVSMYSHTAYSGIITSTTNTNLTQRSCPSVTSYFNAYKNEWGDEIVEYFADFLPSRPATVQDINLEDACIFNIQWERFFDSASAGSKESAQNISANVTRSYLENADGDIWLEAELDNTELSLPEAHFVVNSDLNERNSANLFSAQSFIWDGASTTLDFIANFDFAMSTGSWGNSSDSKYRLTIGATQGLQLSSSSIFPLSIGSTLAQNTYESDLDVFITDSAKNFRSLSISFNVNPGDKFQLYGESQAFALNGGWIDSANTMRTKLTVQGLTDSESADILSSSLRFDVPEPSIFALLLITIAVISSRQVFKLS